MTGRTDKRSWRPLRQLAGAVAVPLERFFRTEASGGLALALATVAALAWANSPFAHAYEAIWQTPIGLRVGPLAFERTLHFWINDGLMTVFFFVVGLEIRWEMYEGDLSSPRRAALPLAGALGGMLVPAAIYLAFAHRGEVMRGWGVPMATDIAFATGVLTALGDRVGGSTRVLLLALAVIDDIGAIAVIAIFYSSGFALGGLALAATGAAIVYLLRKVGVRRTIVYLVPALLVWSGFLRGGVHPTMAGVVLGLLTPVRAWYEPSRFEEAARGAAEAAASTEDLEELLGVAGRVEEARRGVVPAALRFRVGLHDLVAFVIMPLFALANAGVRVDPAALRSGAAPLVVIGVVVGLVVGKPIGVVTASFLAVKARLASMPERVAWRDIVLVGVVAGVGFTMSLFTAALAFPDGALLEAAKIAVLAASVLAATAGATTGIALARRRARASSPAEAAS